MDVHYKLALRAVMCTTDCLPLLRIKAVTLQKKYCYKNKCELTYICQYIIVCPLINYQLYLMLSINLSYNQNQQNFLQYSSLMTMPRSWQYASVFFTHITNLNEEMKQKTLRDLTQSNIAPLVSH